MCALIEGGRVARVGCGCRQLRIGTSIPRTLSAAAGNYACPEAAVSGTGIYTDTSINRVQFPAAGSYPCPEAAVLGSRHLH